MAWLIGILIFFGIGFWARNKGKPEKQTLKYDDYPIAQGSIDLERKLQSVELNFTPPNAYVQLKTYEGKQESELVQKLKEKYQLEQKLKQEYEFGSNRHKHSPKAKEAFLSKFIKPTSLASLADWWPDKLGCLLEDAISKYKAEGLIAEVDLHCKIEIKYKMPEIRELCREQGLKVSGKKEDLIKALVEKIPTTLTKLTDDIHPHQLTDEGLRLVQQYYKNEHDEFHRYRDKIIEHLLDGNLTDAVALSKQYKANLMWPEYVDTDFSIKAVSAILGSSLGNRNECVAAGVLYLLPESYPGKFYMEKH